MTNQMTKVKSLILAAGIGSRLKPLTETTPKCLIPISDCPLLDYWFNNLDRTNVRDVLINTHHLPEQVRIYLNQINEKNRFHVSEAFEPELLGSAGTISANHDWMDNADDCLIIYADNLSNVDLATLIQFHNSHSDPFTMLLFRTPNPKACGIAELDMDNRIVSFSEKPENPKSNLANAGVYVVSAEAYRQIAEMNQFDLGFDILPKFLGQMRGWVFDGYHLDIGTHESLQKAQTDAPHIFPGQTQRRA